jgi:hypothetical protein
MLSPAQEIKPIVPFVAGSTRQLLRLEAQS